MAHLFQYQQGELVDVAPAIRRGRPNSQGGRAIVKATRSSSPTSVVYDVQYVLDRKLSKEVAPERISTAIIFHFLKKKHQHIFPIICT